MQLQQQVVVLGTVQECLSGVAVVVLGTVQKCLSGWLGVVDGGECGWPYDYVTLQTWLAGWVGVEVIGRIISLRNVLFVHRCLRRTTS